MEWGVVAAGQPALSSPAYEQPREGPAGDLLSAVRLGLISLLQIHISVC